MKTFLQFKSNLSNLISFFFIGFVVCLAFLLIIWSYLTTESALNKQTKAFFLQNKRIVDIILDQQLLTLENSLAELNFHKPAIKRLLENDDEGLLEDYELREDIDLFYFITREKTFDLSNALFDTERMIATLEAQQVKKSIVGIQTDENIQLMHACKQLIDDDIGRVFAKVCEATVLNDNFQLIEKIKARIHLSSFALAHKNTILTSNISKEDEKYNFLKEALKVQEGTHKHFKEMVLSKHNLDIAPELYFIVATENDFTQNLQSVVFKQVAIILLIMVLMYLVINALIQNNIIEPLKNLLLFSKLATEGREKNLYESTGVTEFDSLGKSLEEVIWEVKELKVRYELAITGAKDGLWDWDISKNEVFFSHRWKEMLGFNDEEIENHYKEWEIRIHKEDTQKVLDVLNGHLSGQNPYEVNFRMLCKNGEYKWILSRGEALFDEEGKPYRMVGFHTDNDEKVRLENELKLFNKRLEEKVDAQVNEIQKKDKMLMQQSKMAAMGEMLGAIAHQWRQPLNVLGLNIQALEDYYEDEEIDEEFIDDFIEKNMRHIRFMSKTIDDFRGFYKVNKTKTQFRVDEKIHDIIAMFEQQFKSNNIELFYDELPCLSLGFASEFQQVVMNLLSNAKDAILERRNKENDLIGNIKLSTQTTKNSVIIVCEDNGGGIPQEIIERVFDAYYTTKGPSQGTGLGLYISKIIIDENLGGTLTVENTVEGARFSIELEKINE